MCGWTMSDGCMKGTKTDVVIQVRLDGYYLLQNKTLSYRIRGQLQQQMGISSLQITILYL